MKKRILNKLVKLCGDDPDSWTFNGSDDDDIIAVNNKVGVFSVSDRGVFIFDGGWKEYKK